MSDQDQSIKPTPGSTPEPTPVIEPDTTHHDAVWDVAIVGAGIAGLTCAQQLQQAGKRVVVIEKSRGFGGRAATKRLPNFRADSGLPYLTRSGTLSAALIEQLLTAGIIRPWQGQVYDDLAPLSLEAWVAPEGANAIGKYLARSLTVWRSRRAIELQPTAQGWQLRLEPVAADSDAPLHLIARAVVVATPAPQALELLQTLQTTAQNASTDDVAGFVHGLTNGLTNNLVLDGAGEGVFDLTDLTESLAQVDYEPCLTVIAGFNHQVTRNAVTSEVTDKGGEITGEIGETHERVDELAGKARTATVSPRGSWDAIELQNHPQVRWLGIESHKRSLSSDDPWVLTLHSTPDFARQWLEAPNLEAIAAQLLRQIAHEFNLPPLEQVPDCLIVHRWRYAFVQKPAPLPLSAPCLSTVWVNGDQSLALACCGDWCGDDRVEAALRSAIGAAQHILQAESKR